MFYLSFGEIVDKEHLSLFKNNIVVHESDLPMGKGWSPMTWEILEGARCVPITLFEASIEVDSGSIYLQDIVKLEGNELVEDWRLLQSKSTIKLCRKFVNDYPNILKTKRLQKGDSSHYPRRTFSDSQLNINKTILDQFKLLRVVDNRRYPAWFEIENTKYKLKILKH